MKALTERQRRFVEAYMGEAAGNGTKAAEIAGFSGDSNALGVYAHRLLMKPQVQEAIEGRVNNDPVVATRLERQQFWTKTMGDPDVPWKDRLRASELLGRSQADFVELHHHEGTINVDVSAARDRVSGVLVSVARRVDPKRLPESTQQ